MMETFLKLLAIFVIAWLVIGIFNASRILKKRQKEMMDAYEQKREMYRHIDEATFDQTPDNALKDGIITHIFDKEDEDFEHLKENLTDGERVIYTIYQMDIAVDQGRGSVYQFFNSPSKAYLPHLIESYQAVGSQTLADLMQKIIDLVIQEQSGKYDEADLDEDAPTFQSLTYDYMDLVESEKLEEKIVHYIREHKESFLN